MNACDACQQGGIIRAEVDKGPVEGQVPLDIHDDGCGIPSENLNAIFDPFLTTKKRGEGTGLGLTVVASIVRNHGGALTSSSCPPTGSSRSERRFNFDDQIGAIAHALRNAGSCMVSLQIEMSMKCAAIRELRFAIRSCGLQPRT